ncbi:MAG: hypothetical protein HY059_22785 [Proteobacteria bacterium]|nr:hypothetical protein [Pseudomonadota bacterium]
MKLTSLFAALLLAGAAAFAHEPKTEVFDTDEAKPATALMNAAIRAIYGDAEPNVTAIGANRIDCNYSAHGVAGPIAVCHVQKTHAEIAQVVAGETGKDLYSALYRGANGDEGRLCDKWQCRIVATEFSCDANSGAGAKCSYYFAEIR